MVFWVRFKLSTIVCAASILAEHFGRGLQGLRYLVRGTQGYGATIPWAGSTGLHGYVSGSAAIVFISVVGGLSSREHTQFLCF